MTKKSRKCKNMYFRGLQTIDYVQTNVPDAEHRVFCQFCFLTGKQEPVILRRMLGPDKETSLKIGGEINKSLCILPLGWVKMVFSLLLYMLQHTCMGNLCLF